jgi:anti-sigma B factor antagonist
MEFEIREINDVSVIDMSGSLDTVSANSAEEQFEKLLSTGATKIIVNGQGVDYIASSGLRVIMATGNKLAKTGGEIRLCSLNETVLEVFVMSSLDTIYKISETEAEALKDF